MVVSIQAAKGTSIDLKNNPVQNNNGRAIVSQGQGANTIELLPTNSLPNIVILVKPGDGECPDWAIGKVTYSRCSVIKKSISGEELP